MARWRANNLDRAREAVRRWSKNNKPKVAASAAKRKASLLRAIPSWADKNAIAEIYQVALARTKETGIKHHVDHIVPLRGATVCGLHVQSNLRVIPASDNFAKSNRQWPDMP